MHTLRSEVDRCVKMAELIEYNLEDVDAAILAVRVALAKGMSWEDLARMVKEEKKSGNPVAGLIDKLHLERNCITLLLSNNLDEMDDDEKTLPADKVSINYTFGILYFNICLRSKVMKHCSLLFILCISLIDSICLFGFTFFLGICSDGCTQFCAIL